MTIPTLTGGSNTPPGHRFYPPGHYWEVDRTRPYPAFVCSCGKVVWSPEAPAERPNPWWELHAFAVSLARIAWEAEGKFIRKPFVFPNKD